MGTWGHRIFENDEALDFVWEVEEGGLNTIQQAIYKVASIPETEHLESLDCTEALAAMEYVAAAKGNQSEDFPEEAEIWIENKGGKELTTIDTAILIRTIEKIRDNSELCDLWKEGNETEKWYQTLSDLGKRLS